MAGGGQFTVSLNNDCCIVGGTNGTDTILGIVAAVFDNGIVQHEGVTGRIPSDGATCDKWTIDLSALLKINSTHRHLRADAHGDHEDCE